MKKTIIALGILSLVSCQKDWSCETTTTTTSEFGVSTSSNQYHFRGTKPEKKTHENSGSSMTQHSGYTVSVKTKCN